VANVNCFDFWVENFFNNLKKNFSIFFLKGIYLHFDM
jgi:hypothetical protein